MSQEFLSEIKTKLFNCRVFSKDPFYVNNKIYYATPVDGSYFEIIQTSEPRVPQDFEVSVVCFQMGACSSPVACFYLGGGNHQSCVCG